MTLYFTVHGGMTGMLSMLDLCQDDTTALSIQGGAALRHL